MRHTLLLLALASLAHAADARPKVRAITAFINIDAKSYESQYAETMRFLDTAREQYRAAGWDVEGVRIATQPFAQYIRGMQPDASLAFFHKLDELATKLKFNPNIGAAMIGDADDASVLDVLAKTLATTRLNASLVIAADDGIHWRALREAAKLIKNVAALSPNGRGNLNFAAIAIVKPYGPFYPGACRCHALTNPYKPAAFHAVQASGGGYV
jgi:uncharacterized protein (UPF0210 family)